MRRVFNAKLRPLYPWEWEPVPTGATCNVHKFILLKSTLPYNICRTYLPSPGVVNWCVEWLRPVDDIWRRKMYKAISMYKHIVFVNRNVTIKYILLIFQVHKNLIPSVWKQTHEWKVKGGGGGEKYRPELYFRYLSARRETHNFLRILLRIYSSKRKWQRVRQGTRNKLGPALFVYKLPWICVGLYC